MVISPVKNTEFHPFSYPPYYHEFVTSNIDNTGRYAPLMIRNLNNIYGLLHYALTYGTYGPMIKYIETFNNPCSDGLENELVERFRRIKQINPKFRDKMPYSELLFMATGFLKNSVDELQLPNYIGDILLTTVIPTDKMQEINIWEQAYELVFYYVYSDNFPHKIIKHVPYDEIRSVVNADYIFTYKYPNIFNSLKYVYTKIGDAKLDYVDMRVVSDTGVADTVHGSTSNDETSDTKLKGGTRSYSIMDLLIVFLLTVLIVVLLILIIKSFQKEEVDSVHSGITTH